MKLVLDMVHNNPGEAPFRSAFNRASHLAEYGYTGQVFKHLNCVATFAKTGVNLFPEETEERSWWENLTGRIEQNIKETKANGIAVYFHIDLFVLPRRLVDHFRDEVTDPATGGVSLARARTLELHRVLFDELVERFPQVDGYIVRVGETYLFDSPYHTGNGAVPFDAPPWEPLYGYDQVLAGEPTPSAWTAARAAEYVTLLRFLREEICVRHDRHLIFRTWDMFPDRLHASRAHYLDVTDRIAPHPKLLFSIKHTALDFWRRVNGNPCLGAGSHYQLVEVQCQREYEGKGAFPNYVMAGVVNGFEENGRGWSLAQALASPLVCGVFGWSRGGGWHGPYIKDELWPDLNAFVLAQFTRRFPERSERELLAEYARQKLKLGDGDVGLFCELCLLSSGAVLRTQYCEAFDRALDGSVIPTGLWIRDDRLGGRRQLRHVFSYLLKHSLVEEAIQEKADAVAVWERMAGIARQIRWSDAQREEQVIVSVEYGRALARIIHHGWRVLALGAIGDSTGSYARNEIDGCSERYDNAWREFRALAASPQCASLYVGQYFNLPGKPSVAGLDESIEHYRRIAAVALPNRVDETGRA